MGEREVFGKCGTSIINCASWRKRGDAGGEGKGRTSKSVTEI